MTAWVDYDATTGNIITNGECPDDQFATQDPPATGLTRLEGNGSPITHWVDAGVITAYTTDEREAKSARPDTTSVWDNTTMSWSGTPLADYKNLKQDALVATRDTKLYGVNLQHHGTAGDGSQDVLVSIDANHRERIRNAAFEALVIETRAAGTFVDRFFRDQSTNLLVELDDPECIKLQQTVDTYTEAVWDTYDDTRQAIDVAADFAAAAAALAGAVWPDPEA